MILTSFIFALPADQLATLEHECDEAINMSDTPEPAPPSPYQSRQMLKIKHLSLQHEIRDIRRQELRMRKWKKRAAEGVANAQKYQAMTQAEKDAMRGVRAHTWKENKGFQEGSHILFWLHRTKEVRPYARAVHIARGYLSNVPYRAMEAVAFKTPNWGLIWAHILQFGQVNDTREEQDKFMAWADAMPTGISSKHNMNHDYTAKLREPKPSILIMPTFQPPTSP